MDYRFERINEKNIEDLVFLFQASKKSIYDSSYFKNKFDTSYTGKKFIGFLAYNLITNEPSAFYGVYPVMLEYKTKFFLGAQSGDTITHPKHQKKGLFIELAKLTYELCLKEDIKLIFGFPNSNSSHGFYAKLGWKKDHVVNRYIINTKHQFFLRVFNKFFYRFFIRLLLDLGSKKTIGGSLDCNSKIVIRRDKEYYSYKTFTKNYFVKINNISIWFKIENGLHIGDIMCEDENLKNKIIPSIIQLSNLLLTDTILLLISDNHKYCDIFQNYLVDGIDFTCGKYFVDKNIEDVNLSFTFGDFDTF